MKIVLIVSTICLLPLHLISQDVNFKNDSTTIRNLEYNWLISEFKLDTATISKMMDTGFISIGVNSISNKQEELDGTYKNISQRLKNNHFVDSLYFDDFQIKIHGTTAIVTYISVTKGTIKGVPFSNRRTRIYDVWVKKNNQWKAISSQITPIATPKNGS